MCMRRNHSKFLDISNAFYIFPFPPKLLKEKDFENYEKRDNKKSENCNNFLSQIN